MRGCMRSGSVNVKRIAQVFCVAGASILIGVVPAQQSRYPKTDAVSGYQVDPNWPAERIPGDEWGAMSGVTLGPDGNIWTFNRGKIPIQVFTSAGKLVRSWGQDSGFKNPHSIKFDREGSLWASDTRTHTVRKFSPDGKLLMTLGTPDQAGEDATHFNQPNDQAFGPNGDIYISDGYGNNRVAVFSKGGKFLRSWGKLGTGPGEFSLPHAVAVDSRGRVLVADRNNARVQIFDAGGKFLTEWKNFIIPHYLSITANDDVLICGSSPMLWSDLGANGVFLGVPPKDQMVIRLDRDGRLKQLWSFPMGNTGSPGELTAVHNMAVGPDGSLYLADVGARRVQRFESSGVSQKPRP
jgi:hypothetical protein